MNKLNIHVFGLPMANKFTDIISDMFYVVTANMMETMLSLTCSRWKSTFAISNTLSTVFSGSDVSSVLFGKSL